MKSNDLLSLAAAAVVAYLLAKWWQEQEQAKLNVSEAERFAANARLMREFDRY